MRKTVVAISSASVASALPTIRTTIASSWAAVFTSTATWSSTSAPLASRRTVQPGGTTTVVSYSSTSSGPAAGSTSSARERIGVSTNPSPKSARRVRGASDAGGRSRERDGRPLRPERDEPQRTDVDGRPALEPRAVERLVLGLETLDEGGERLGVDLAGEVDRHAPALAAVAHVGDALPVVRRAAHLGVEPAQLAEIALPRRAGRSARRATRRRA